MLSGLGPDYAPLAMELVYTSEWKARAQAPSKHSVLPSENLAPSLAPVHIRQNVDAFSLPNSWTPL